jgi:hypothetical protein
LTSFENPKCVFAESLRVSWDSWGLCGPHFEDGWKVVYVFIAHWSLSFCFCITFSVSGDWMLQVKGLKSKHWFLQTLTIDKLKEILLKGQITYLMEFNLS